VTILPVPSIGGEQGVDSGTVSGCFVVGMSDFMTDPGEPVGLVDGLPGDAAGAARVVQGLMVHER
jgi:hypothetical protein